MANSALVLGIDFGTSGVRIAVLNMDGELIHTSSTDYQKGLEDPEDLILDLEQGFQELRTDAPKSSKS